MAATSSKNEKTLHSDKYYCKECVMTVVKAYERTLVAVWQTILQFMMFKTLKSGYALSIPNTGDTKLSASDDSDAGDNVTPRPCTYKAIKLTMIMYKASKRKPDFINVPGSICFLVNEIPYVDIEVVMRMVSMISSTQLAKRDMVLSRITCCSGKPVLPVITIDDIVINNQSTLIHGQRVTPLSLQIKATIRSHRQGLSLFMMSRLEVAFKDITTELSMSPYDNQPDGRVIKDSEISSLKEMVTTLFTDVYDGDVVCYPIRLVKSHELPLHSNNITKTCDAIFVVEDYSAIYMQSYIEKYIDLFLRNRQHLPWKLIFIGMENDPKNNSGTNNDVIIGFNYIGEQPLETNFMSNKKHVRKETEVDTKRPKKQNKSH